ncbi:MAG: nitrilase-related carbon-nitrogen hydrolase [Bdellovibrionota bacterium]
MGKKTSKIKVALLQMNSGEDVSKNVQFIFDNLEKMKSHGPMPRLVCTPENSLFMRAGEGTEIKFLKPDATEIKSLCDWCKINNTNLHLGSLPLELPEGKFNSSLLLRADGSFEASYQKMHLFDIHLKDQKPIRESDVFTHGAQPSVFEIDGWKFGQTVCYDIRFGELYQHYSHASVDVILIPAAFLVTTGRAHWEILLRARAIENQAYVLASAQSGLHTGATGKTRRIFGYTMAIDPWGYVAYQNPAELTYGIIELDEARLAEVRAQIPMSSHRRDFFR